MLKILQARPQQNVNQELLDVKLDLEKAEEAEIKLIYWITKKPKEFRKTSTFASLLH